MSLFTLIAELRFGSTDLVDPAGLFFDRIIRGGPGTTPNVRGTDDILPGAPGRFARNRVADIRTIEIEGWVAGDGATVLERAEDYWANRIAAATLFDPTITRVLRATLPTGAAYAINARALPLDGYKQVDPTHADITVVLESVDPFWVAV